MADDAPEVRIAASPINWHNDDFPILGSLTSVDAILAGMQAAGMDGTELGSLFPTTRDDLEPLLDQYGLELAGGWFSAYLLTRDMDDERKRFVGFVQFLESMGTRILTIAECSYCPFKPFPPSPFAQHFGSLAVPLFPYQLPELTPDQWTALGKGLQELSDIAEQHGIAVGYHPHMQTVVQTAEQLAMLADAAPDLHFTIDTGHLRFAGADAVAVLETYIDRTVHLHIKDVRDHIADVARAGSMSFAFAVIEGAFTVPGDGAIDYVKVFDILKRHRYRGWMVVEAEQNPLTSDPVLYAKLGREYIPRGRWMVSPDRNWDVRPFEAWIVDEYLPSLRLSSRPGDYARRPGETETALYGAADVACILYSLSRLDPSRSDAAEWLDLLAGFQDPVSGFFVDRSASLSTAHNTGFAVGAMNLLRRELSNGQLPKAPLRFARLLREPADAERFAGSLDWRNDCYEAGENLIGHASSFFNVSGAMPADWFQWLVDYIERTKMDEANGMVGVDKPPGGDADQIGATLHFDFFWAALGRQLPFASARTEALLGLQLPTGLWDPNNPWWLTFDAIYMLRRTLPDLSADQATSVRAAVARAASALTARSSDPDLRRSDFVEPWIGAHMLTGAVSFFAYAQQVLGESRVITDRPLRSVLDRRPYI